MLNTIHIQGRTESFTAEEVAANLEHGILNRVQLLHVVAARVAGFDYVAAGALLYGVDGHPDALADVVRIFERDQPELFALLVDDVVEMIGAKSLRAGHKKLRQAHAVAAIDALKSVHAHEKLLSLADSKPTAAHRKERAEQRFEALIAKKKKETAGGNVDPYIKPYHTGAVILP